jgi:hypothetical protein
MKVPPPSTDLLLAVSLLEPRREGAAEDLRLTLAGPFIIHVRAPLQPGYAFTYEVRLRNVSVDCDCVPSVATLSARLLPTDNHESTTQPMTHDVTDVSR